MVQQCCVAGEIHTGTPAGRVDKVHGVDCYIAEPPAGTTPKGVIIVLPDIFGWASPNTRILADSYAEKGPFIVYLPEMHAGKSFPIDLLTSIHALEATGLAAAVSRAYHMARVTAYWLPFSYANSEDTVRARLYPFIGALRQQHAELSFGVAGFCWGGFWSFKLAHDRPEDRVEVNGVKLPLVDASFAAHPSLMKIPDDIEAIVKPTSVAAAAIDARYPKEDVDRTREILERKMQLDASVKHEVVWYPGCHHGWAVRGNPEDPKEGEAGIRAELQAMEWFAARFAEVKR
ncbi:dienelactone hydrolase family protein [Phyllosticta capitalensis]|uniref:Dienelactone hydrolase n=1 Tax=Phyllosticta capitalensis TaxID=121624 RepID=A0ABR1YL36_9PEZI